MSAEKEKNVFYELLRLIAISLVILNHLPIATAFMTERGISGAAYTVIAIIIRINVPLFFMISGALLLRKDEDLKTVLKKRVLRFVIVLLAVQLGIYLTSALVSVLKTGHTDASVWDFIWKFFGDSVPGGESYWFLYSYLALLCFLPFLRRIVTGITKYEFLAILTMHFVISSAIPYVNLVASCFGLEDIGWPSRFQLPLVTTKAFFYAIFGYCLDARVRLGRVKEKRFSILGMALLAIFSSYLFVHLVGEVNGYSENSLGIFDYILAIAVFIGIKLFCDDHEIGAGAKKFILTAGSLSFGIYLLDPFLKAALYSKYTALCADRLNFALFSFGWLFISLLLGGLLTFVLKKLPVIRDLI